ncbi:MAG: response regulator [Myxococcales bacterium]
MAKKILLIDSDAGLVGSATSDLESKGFEVLHTADGKEGIDLARQHRPDLVVLCVELPKASGYSICSKLKKDEELRSIPVILTSAEAKQKTFDDHKKLKVGRADEYLIKPFQSSALLSKVEELIGLPEGGAGLGDLGDEPLDISGLAEEVSVAGEEPLEEPVTVEEVDEISVDESEGAPTPQTLPGDEDLAMLDSAFENLAPANGKHSADLEEAHLEPPGEAAGGEEDLLAALEAPAPVEAHAEAEVVDEPEPVPAGGEELERLREEVATLQRQLANAAETRPAPGATKDKEYFAVKEKLAQRDKDLLRLREELNEKDKELVDQRDKEMVLEQQISAHGAEIGKREAQIKTLQQKVDALVAGQKRTERDLAASREEAKQATARMQAAEQELSTVQAAAAEHESTALRVTQELETASARVTELETEVGTERSRNDELSAELHGTRTQLEEAQNEAEELRRRVTDLEDQGGKNEERVVKAYQKIKGDEKLKEKVKKALGIALQLLEEQGLEVDEIADDRQ